MRSTLQKILYVPDAHHPYASAKAWKTMLAAGKGWKPDVIVVLGDLGDFYCVSSHLKTRIKKPTLVQEVAAVNKALDALESLGATRLIFIEGNHETRLHRFLSEKAPELFGVVDVESLLGLKRRGWEFVPYFSHIKIGKIRHTHDVGFVGRAAAHRNLDFAKSSIITAHTHRFGYVVEGDIDGEPHLSASFGWLGDPEQIDYTHRMKALKDSAHGFGLGYHDTTTGYVYITPVPIIKGQCCVEGKIYRAAPLDKRKR